MVKTCGYVSDALGMIGINGYDYIRQKVIFE